MLGENNRKTEILEAALACFAEIGYGATSIDHIRQRSGASVGSIYHHFGNKEGIATALYMAVLEKYRDGLMAVFEANSGGEAVVKAVVRFHIDWAMENPDLERYLLHMRREAGAGDGEQTIRKATGSFLSRIGVHIKPLIENGEVKALVKELYIPLIIGPAQELIRLWLSGRSEIDLRDVREDLAEAAWNALKP